MLATAALALLLAATSDPLVRTIERLHQEAGSSQPRLDAASKALDKGRRLLAIYQTATILPSIEGEKFANGFPKAERDSEASFEKEWKRENELNTEKKLTPIEPALLRAFGEGSLLRSRNFYHASLDFARSTTPESGFGYLGRAHGEESLIAFLRTLSTGSHVPAPPLRALSPDIDSLQHILLGAYHPPASINQHDEFIAASAVLKEARELDEAGLRYGALFRFLDAAQRTGQLAGTPGAVSDLRAHLAKWRERLGAMPGDQSIAQLFLEFADADLETGQAPAMASSVDSFVLPRYFAALGPAPKQLPRPKAVAHVTLVRWPYT
ncbi:MAG TPA: hypothetical protein VH087_17575 [Thermoanaerobaculia bacterium]|jgi:hypothetical protein|nr:hypothetical protein [Thermoanaerobaculia bacterium]